MVSGAVAAAVFFVGMMEHHRWPVCLALGLFKIKIDLIGCQKAHLHSRLVT